MIGDTGTIEGGKRSADCEGSEGGGVIALLRFDKMDMLHTTQPCLAYKLAMSFGGVCVRKLRQAMGKVFKKDNKARAGENIGKRLLHIPETIAPDRTELHHGTTTPPPHAVTIASVPTESVPTTATIATTAAEQTAGNEGDNGNDVEVEEKKEESKEVKKSRWKKIKHAVHTVKKFAVAKKIGGLYEEEILYLARAKRIRDPLSEEAEKEMREKVVRLTKERDEALDQVHRMNVAVRNAQNSDQSLLLEAAVASAACKRYEKRWTKDYIALSAITINHVKVIEELKNIKAIVVRDETRHSNTLRDMEDELEFIRGREVLLGKKCRTTESEVKMLRVRLQSKTMTYETHVTNTNETHAGKYI